MASLTCNTVRLSPDVQTGRSHVVMEVRPGVGVVRPGVQQEVGQELQQLLGRDCLAGERGEWEDVTGYLYICLLRIHAGGERGENVNINLHHSPRSPGAG